MPRPNPADTARRALNPRARKASAQASVPPRLSLSVQVDPKAGQCPVDRSQLRRWAKAALRSDASLTLRLVGLSEGRALNRQFRGRDYATNVLTFAYDSPAVATRHASPLEADIIICLPVLVREARAQRKALRDHLAHLVIHGCLHAQGLDHESEPQAQEMEALESGILARFRIADPYR